MAAGRRSTSRWQAPGSRSKRVDGLRVTDAETLDIVRMVLVGKINRELVAAINALEPVAIGVAGEDGRLLEVEPIDERWASSAGSPRSAAACSTPCSTTG